MDSIRNRFQNDFAYVLHKVSTASEGLGALYGYPTAAPDYEKFTELFSADAVFERVMLWIRNAINWVTQFSAQDLTYVARFSIKELVGGPEWNTGLEKRRWKFNINEADFETPLLKQRHVRVRGVGGSVVEKTNNGGAWRITLKPPRQSFCRFENGTKSELDQSRSLGYVLGRVTQAHNNPEGVGIDTTGQTSGYNISPYGEWELVINDHSTAGIRLEEISDVLLDMGIVFQGVVEE